MHKILIRTCKNQPSNSFAEASMNIVKLQNTHIATAPVNKRCGSDKILIYINSLPQKNENKIYKYNLVTKFVAESIQFLALIYDLLLSITTKGGSLRLCFHLNIIMLIRL